MAVSIYTEEFESKTRVGVPLYGTPNTSEVTSIFVDNQKFVVDNHKFVLSIRITKLQSQ